MAESLGVIVGAVYLAGFIVGLFAVDEPLPGRLGVAAAWPLGPLACVVVLTILVVALPIALPSAAAWLAAVLVVVWLMSRFIM
jgi:hypothetical protein